MSNIVEQAGEKYRILVNGDGQHSLWPIVRDVPAGWAIVGPTGERERCLEWIGANWAERGVTSDHGRSKHLASTFEAPRVGRRGAKGVEAGSNLRHLDRFSGRAVKFRLSDC
ncbi:MAG TPA: MbtH family protein [Terrimicrobiaceae bacterium]